MHEGLLTRTRRRPSLCTGYSDPFLVVYNGSKKQNKINDEANALKDTLNPQFYKCFELPTLIPGNPLLKIEVWDKDSDGAHSSGRRRLTSRTDSSRKSGMKWSPSRSSGATCGARARLHRRASLSCGSNCFRRRRRLR